MVYIGGGSYHIQNVKYIYIYIYILGGALVILYLILCLLLCIQPTVGTYWRCYEYPGKGFGFEVQGCLVGGSGLGLMFWASTLNCKVSCWRCLLEGLGLGFLPMCSWYAVLK